MFIFDPEGKDVSGPRERSVHIPPIEIDKQVCAGNERQVPNLQYGTNPRVPRFEKRSGTRERQYTNTSTYVTRQPGLVQPLASQTRNKPRLVTVHVFPPPHETPPTHVAAVRRPAPTKVKVRRTTSTSLIVINRGIAGGEGIAGCEGLNRAATRAFSRFSTVIEMASHGLRAVKYLPSARVS